MTVLIVLETFAWNWKAPLDTLERFEMSGREGVTKNEFAFRILRNERESPIL